MKRGRQRGVFEDRGFLWTANKVPGQAVYGERLRTRKGTEYRNWNPYRSKLAALAQSAPQTPWVDARRDVLYLGASSGTTVSHVSDILEAGARVFAVESSPRSMRDLLWNIEPRPDVIPVLEDAGRPERYAAYLDRPVGSLVQDVAQRHQVDIFLRNLPFLAADGHGFLFIKARSIHVAAPVKDIYGDVRGRLMKEGLDIVLEADLAPFEKEHRAFVVRPA